MPSVDVSTNIYPQETNDSFISLTSCFTNYLVRYSFFKMLTFHCSCSNPYLCHQIPKWKNLLKLHFSSRCSTTSKRLENTGLSSWRACFQIVKSKNIFTRSHLPILLRFLLHRMNLQTHPKACNNAIRQTFVWYNVRTLYPNIFKRLHFSSHCISNLGTLL